MDVSREHGTNIVDPAAACELAAGRREVDLRHDLGVAARGAPDHPPVIAPDAGNGRPDPVGGVFGRRERPAAHPGEATEWLGVLLGAPGRQPPGRDRTAAGRGAAGGTGNGVFTEAKERKEANPDENVWVIGVDADQYEEGQTGDANVTLTSVLKRVDNAVIDISEQAMNGEFPGGETITYGLSDEGVALADSRGAIPEDVMSQIEEYKEKVISGEIEVPETVSE